MSNTLFNHRAALAGELLVAGSLYLTAQLRESAPYLQDAGWRQTGTLLLAAAEEIDRLARRLDELQARGRAWRRARRRAAE